MKTAKTSSLKATVSSRFPSPQQYIAEGDTEGLATSDTVLETAHIDSLQTVLLSRLLKRLDTDSDEEVILQYVSLIARNLVNLKYNSLMEKHSNVREAWLEIANANDDDTAMEEAKEIFEHLPEEIKDMAAEKSLTHHLYAWVSKILLRSAKEMRSEAEF